jgi:hypothetical protein
LVGLVSVSSCSRQPHRVTEPPPEPNPSSDQTLASVCEPLRKATDFESFRNIVEQINGYLAKHPDQKPPVLTPSEMKLLEDAYFLNKEELAEVNSSSFTSLDAHHLDLYLLLHDALRVRKPEQLKPLDRTATAFEWTMRQVTLVDRPVTIERPPHFVVRRGWGNMLERAQVFLAVLDVLGLDGCMLLVPPAQKGQQGPLDYWVVGALVDKDIYLFDTRLGLPLPGPGGKGIATLAQVKAHPELIQALNVEPKQPYDVTGEQAKNAEIQVSCALSALAPRMRLLQEVLSTTGKVNLSKDPTALLSRFKDTGGGNSVQIWNTPGDDRTPIRVLRSFVPPEEGGTDTIKPTSRRDEAQLELIPRRDFPRLKGLPEPIQRQLVDYYAAPFINLPLKSRVPHEQLATWLPGLTRAKKDEGTVSKIPDILLRERMPRDLILHGRLEEAIAFLVALRDELTRQREAKNDPQLQEQAAKWCEQANQVFNQLAAAGNQTANPAALAKAQENMKTLWERSGPVTGEVLGAAAETLLGEVICLLALAKAEQAEQLQAKVGRAGAKPADLEAGHDAWSEAARWPETYLDDYPHGLRQATMVRLRARALEALGRRADAVVLLQKYAAVPILSQSKALRLERLGFLLLAQQIKGS